MQMSADIDLTSTHLQYGAEAYHSDVAANVSGVVRQTVLRDGLTIVSACLHLASELSSQVLLPPGLSLSMVLEGQSLLADEDFHGSNTYTFDLSTRSRWRRLQAASGQVIRFVSLSASLDRLQSLGLDGIVSGDFIAHRGRMPDRIASLASLLYRREPASPTMSLLREAAGLELVGRLLDSHDSGPGCSDGLGPQERRALDQVQAIIDAELDADLTLAALARRVGLGRSRLKTLYRQRYGTPVGASIIEARLMHAHRLLSADARRVAEVAYAVGYTPAHFATAFRRRFGYAPSLVRRAKPG